MILSDNTIRRYVLRKVIEVDPWVPEHVQPAGLDLTLGSDFVGLRDMSHPGYTEGPMRVLQDAVLQYGGQYNLDDLDGIMVVDPKDPQAHGTISVHLRRGQVYVLPPQGFALARTAERFSLPNDIVGLLNGRSSLGRLGLFVHVTAGLFDPGWDGVGTLELYNASPNPIALHPGMRIAQLVFHRMDKPAARPYAGKYQGAAGVQTSRIDRDWKGGDHGEG